MDGNECGEMHPRRYDAYRWVCLKDEGHGGKHRYEYVGPENERGLRGGGVS